MYNEEKAVALIWACGCEYGWDWDGDWVWCYSWGEADIIPEAPSPGSGGSFDPPEPRAGGARRAVPVGLSAGIVGAVGTLQKSSSMARLGCVPSGSTWVVGDQRCGHPAGA